MMTDIKINVINIFCKMFYDDFIWIQYYLDISKNWAQIFYNSKYSPFSDKKSNVWHNVKLHKMCLRVIQFFSNVSLEHCSKCTNKNKGCISDLNEKYGKQ